MALIFEPGTVLKTIQGNDVHIERLLAESGRGAIYQVTVNGQPKALKWCTSSPLDNDFYSFWTRTKLKADLGAPCDSILWPEDITDLSNDGFGYVMQLIPEGYQDLYDILTRKVGFSSFRAIIDVATNLVLVFQQMHLAGYCYCAHHGDFFVNPRSGRVIFTHPDYIVPIGEQFNILGNYRFMAPEVVLGSESPGEANEQYVMSVYLFMLLCLCHPLEGKRSLVPALSSEYQQKLYGSEALFMMDPENDSNGPHRLIHKNTILLWNVLPAYFQALFHRSFGKQGLTNPDSRVAEEEWVEALCRLRGDVLRCDCGSEMFVEEGMTGVCDVCGKPLASPLRLDLSNYSLPAVKGSRLFRCQFGEYPSEEALSPVAHVIEKKDSPGVLGIQNISGETWIATTSKGASRTIDTNEVVPLKTGISIEICNSILRIRESNSSPQDT